MAVTLDTETLKRTGKLRRKRLNTPGSENKQRTGDTNQGNQTGGRTPKTGSEEIRKIPVDFVATMSHYRTRVLITMATQMSLSVH